MEDMCLFKSYYFSNWWENNHPQLGEGLLKGNIYKGEEPLTALY